MSGPAEDGRARILVLGATGMLGHQVASVFSDGFEVHGTVRDLDRAARLGVHGTLHAFDAHQAGRLDDLLDLVRPSAVVNCVGIVKQLEGASRPIPAITINSLFPHQVAEACAARGVRLIHLSTDCVFSGELPPPARYREDDVPDARDLYGRSKLLGEVTAAGTLTIRTSMIGWELERASGLLEWFASQGGRRVGGFRNAIFSGLTTPALARILYRVVRDHPGLERLYHVSAEPVSKYALLSMLRDALAIDCEIEARDEPRINRALDSTRFRDQTGIEAPPWDAMIAELRPPAPTADGHRRVERAGAPSIPVPSTDKEPGHVPHA